MFLSTPTTSAAGDPCRLVRQVKEFRGYERKQSPAPDPCRLGRQVKEFSGRR